MHRMRSRVHGAWTRLLSGYCKGVGQENDDEEEIGRFDSDSVSGFGGISAYCGDRNSGGFRSEERRVGKECAA